MSERLTIVDLFAGAGGLSTGIAKACEDLGLQPESDVELHAVNHWEPAIATHEANHPWAEHYHAKIEELHPPEVVEPGEVDLLVGGPECTHFSTAKGGVPVKEQKRVSAWHVLDWVEKLRPDNILLENVKEFRSWGPVIDGEATTDGSIFRQWIGMLEAFGFNIVWDEADQEYGVVLNAADFGEAQSRERLFIMASRDGTPTAPEPTHDDTDPTKPDRRTAADIIDWSDLGTSIWTRDLTEPRIHSPPKSTTMGRIAEGIRTHCSDALEPFADVLKQLGKEEIRGLREQFVVPAEYAGQVAAAVDEPFLVELPGSTSDARSFVLGQQSNSIARDVSERPVPTLAKRANIHFYTPTMHLLRQQDGGPIWGPVDQRPAPTVTGKGAHSVATTDMVPLVLPRLGRNGGDDSNPAYPAGSEQLHTVTAGNHDGHLVLPSLIRYSHGGATLDVRDPMPTIATERGGVYAMSAPFLTPLYSERSGQRPRTRSLDRPLMTVVASKPSPAMLSAPVVRPFLEDYQGSTQSADRPLGTQPGSDRYALCVPELWPWGLDVRYRMLQPRELKQAQGFPADYDIQGRTKEIVTKQIGNAVPVSLAEALVHHLLTGEDLVGGDSTASTMGRWLHGEEPTVEPYEDVAPEYAGGDD